MHIPCQGLYGTSLFLLFPSVPTDTKQEVRHHEILETNLPQDTLGPDSH